MKTRVLKTHIWLISSATKALLMRPNTFGRLAHLVERVAVNREVVGS